MEVQLLGIKVSVLRAGAVNTGMLGASTDALEKFCEKTKLYQCLSLIHILDTKYPNMRGGFVHVPYSTEQVQNRTTPVPSMQLSEITRGLEIIAETLAK